jgi:hypothetical protein
VGNSYRETRRGQLVEFFREHGVQAVEFGDDKETAWHEIEDGERNGAAWVLDSEGTFAFHGTRPRLFGQFQQEHRFEPSSSQPSLGRSLFRVVFALVALVVAILCLVVLVALIQWNSQERCSTVGPLRVHRRRFRLTSIPP